MGVGGSKQRPSAACLRQTCATLRKCPPAAKSWRAAAASRPPSSATSATGRIPGAPHGLQGDSRESCGLVVDGPRQAATPRNSNKVMLAGLEILSGACFVDLCFSRAYFRTAEGEKQLASVVFEGFRGG